MLEGSVKRDGIKFWYDRTKLIAGDDSVPGIETIYVVFSQVRWKELEQNLGATLGELPGQHFHPEAYSLNSGIKDAFPATNPIVSRPLNNKWIVNRARRSIKVSHVSVQQSLRQKEPQCRLGSNSHSLIARETSQRKIRSTVSG